MQEQEFKKLLDKYLKGNLSEDETNILEKFKEELKSRNQEINFKNEAEKAQFQESIWSGIDMHSNKETKTPRWKLAASVAAIFIGLIATGYLYLQNTSATSSELIPENAITLELEDGTIKVIEENGATHILDENGNLLGRQNGNQLVYENESLVEEMVFNTLKVPYGKTFKLQLSDGTKAHLNAGSSIKYPIKFLKGQDRQIFITGEAYLDVAKNPLQPFIVNANNLNVRVLGTQFNVNAYPEDEITEIVLVEGSVGLYSNSVAYDSQKSTILEPGFQAKYDKSTEQISTEEVITDIYTSWMKGELVFRNMSFKNIMKKLERHYDIKIVMNNKELSDKIFNASFGNEPLSKVLEGLKENYNIEYSLINNELIIN
nr:FecR domain-containing protein [uncultured Allomuricauda sp.]